MSLSPGLMNFGSPNRSIQTGGWTAGRLTSASTSTVCHPFTPIGIFAAAEFDRWAAVSSMATMRTLKISIACLCVALVVSAFYLSRAYRPVYGAGGWRDQVSALSETLASQQAVDDFCAGELRLLKLNGRNDRLRFSGQYDGVYQLWTPRYHPETGVAHRFQREEYVWAYNRKMRYMYDHPDTVKLSTDVLIKMMNAVPEEESCWKPWCPVLGADRVTERIVAEGDHIVPELIANLGKANLAAVRRTLWCLATLKAKEAKATVVELKHGLHDGRRFGGVKRDLLLEELIDAYMTNVDAW